MSQSSEHRVASSEHDAATVLGYSIERKNSTVHLLLRTDRGTVRLRFTPADAQLIGGELRVHAVHPVGERRDPSGPITKPSGTIL